MRVKYYRSEFIAHNGERVRLVCPFTDAQAASVGAVLEPDGIQIAAATRLVEQWNAMRVLDRTVGTYAVILEDYC